MNILVKNSIMFLGSGKGLFLILVVVYTIYIAKKRGNLIYFLWLLLPIIPLVHFFTEKKTKKTWITFALISLFCAWFIYFLEPSVVNDKIQKVSFKIGEDEIVVDREKNPSTIIDIKWDIYTTYFCRNLGIRKKCNYKIVGDLTYYRNNGHVVIFDYPLDNIINIVEAESHKNKT